MKHFIPVMCGVILFLSGCSQHDDTLHATQMQRLQLMMAHAANMAAQGSDQILAGRGESGRNMLSLSADTLRRAMSGPEMNAMHQSGAGLNSMMRKTHDLGGTMFNLLGMMMQSSPEQAMLRRGLNRSLAMAAEGMELVLSGHLTIKDELGRFMIVQGKKLQASANVILAKHSPGDAVYTQAVKQVIEQMNVL